MTDNRTTELLECPFCGGEAETVGDDCMEWIAECIECCASSMAFATEAEAIAAWNARAERTCEIESSYLNDFTSEHECWYEFEMQCGYRFTWDEMEPPTYCPNCGCRIKEQFNDQTH